MNNSTEAMLYVCCFDSCEEAVSYISEIRRHFWYSDHITRAELCDVFGFAKIDDDKYVGWTIDACEHMVCKATEGDYKGYEIYLPQPDWHKETKEMTDIQSEPINVTITVDKWYKKPDVIEQTIQALFKDPEKIKDRPVFITIM